MTFGPSSLKSFGKKYGISVHSYTARALDFSNRPSNFSVMPSNDKVNIGDEPMRRFLVVTDETFDKIPRKL